MRSREVMGQQSLAAATVHAKRRRSQPQWPWYFIIPGVAIFLFVLIVPSIRGIYYSFTNWNGLSPHYNFVGLANFRDFIDDPSSRAVLIRSVEFAVAITILQTAIGLALAMGVNARILGRNSIRVIFFAPVIMMPIVAAYLWQYILGSAPTAPLNELLARIGLARLEQGWLAEPSLAFWSIVIVVVWQFSGITMAIFLAGLQGIPKDLLDQASTDGAGPVRRFFSITLPLLKYAVIVNVMLTLIGGLKLFDQIWVLTRGGPGNATNNLGTSIYENVFIYGDLSYGITLGVVMLIVVVAFAITQFRLLNRRSAERL